VYRRYSNYRGYNLNSLWAILGANVVLFIITIAFFYVDRGILDDVLDYLALERAKVWPYLWTLVTSMFMHGGLLHIAINMWMLYMFGSYVVMLVGQRKFLLVYFVGGITGGLLVIALTPTAAVGASGAIFALGALLAVMMPKMRVIMFPLFIPVPLWGAILFGLIATSFIPGVAWQAHLGGAIAGLAFGLYFRRKRPRVIFLQ
jgi:membrane associated rhomboid family serine protease